jgi:hypothetical protein
MTAHEDCVCCVLEEIHGFRSLIEFERFQGYIANLVQLQELNPIPVRVRYNGSIVNGRETFVPYHEYSSKKKYPKNTVVGLGEEWYECTGCHQKWRLEYPSFPSRGAWLIIKND